jgi:hypothetical protein
MKRFLIKILSYILGFIIVWSFSLTYGYLKIRKNNHFFSIEKNINKVFIGDSHFEFSINDSIISNSLNISYSADNYFYSYLKLRELLKHNKLDTVFISYSLHSLSAGLEKGWLYNPLHFESRFSKYIYFENSEDINQLIDFMIKIPAEFLSTSFFLPLHFFKNKKIKNFTDLNIGKFIYSKQNNITNIEELVKKDFQKKQLNHFSVSKKQKEYLLKIVSLCNKYKVTLILINTPVHKIYFNNLPEKVKNSYKNFYQTYLTNYILMDYSQYKIPDYCFKDCDHLNGKGADLFTKELVNRLYKKY